MIMPADAPATTPPPSNSPELAALSGVVHLALLDRLDADLFDAADVEHVATAVLSHLKARVRVDGATEVPDWYVRLDQVADADVFPIGVREDVASALRYVGELHLAASVAMRDRAAALRGTQRALLAQRDATDALALALLKADDSLTPQHPAEQVAALKEVAKAARAVVAAADDGDVVGSGDDVMMRLAQGLAAVES